MKVIASANGQVGIDAAWEVLANGGTAIDAVETGIRLVEDNPDDHSVGFGGYPNLVGAVELDASIMDGATRAAGAVGALQGYRHAITVARAVLERLPHVVVVGDGAARLAGEIGLTPEVLLTGPAEHVWSEGRRRQIVDDPNLTGASLIDQVAAVIGQIYDNRLARAIMADLPAPGGTVNFIAQDHEGHLASAVSTSGWIWKYPGRLGDSPMIGAGNYCDDRFGAAACTGWGELAIRAGAARMVVAGVAGGATLAAACAAVLSDIQEMERHVSQRGHVSIISMNRSGEHHAASTKPGAEYVWRADGMPNARREPREVTRLAE